MQGRNSLSYLTVKIDSATYSSLGIFVNNNGQLTQISSLTTTTDICSLLVVQAQRSDKVGAGGGWVPVPGNWSESSGLTSNSPPLSSQTWHFCASNNGSGTITASYGSLTPATINVTVNSGQPASIALYQSSSGIQYNDPSVTTYTVVAGATFPMFVKVFDSKGVWLHAYDSAGIAITWQIDPALPVVGSLTFPNGNSNGFIGTVAPKTVNLIATFSVGGKVFADTVRVQIVPGAVNHLTIQSDTASINGVDISHLVMQSTDTSKSMYAVERDKYGNFVSYAVNAQWMSADSTVVKAFPYGLGSPVGQGSIYRVADNAESTMVYASKDGFVDSLEVAVSNITYTKLRIYSIIAAGDTDFFTTDTLHLRTDQTGTLYTEGLRSDGKGWQNIAALWSLTGRSQGQRSSDNHQQFLVDYTSHSGKRFDHCRMARCCF